MRGITTHYETTTTPNTMETNKQPDQEKSTLNKQQAIKAIHRADRAIIITAHDLDESGNGLLAGSAMVEGTAHEIINMLVNAMKRESFLATCIVASSALYLNETGKL